MTDEALEARSRRIESAGCGGGTHDSAAARVCLAAKPDQA